MRCRLAAVVALTSACAVFRPVHPAEWITAWSDEVLIVQETGGKIFRSLQPAAGARIVVIPRADYLAQIRSGKRPRVEGQGGPVDVPVFLDLLRVRSPLLLQAGDLRRFSLRPGAVRELAMAGNSLRAYWSSASVYLEAARPGTSVLRIAPPRGAPKILQIEVR